MTATNFRDTHEVFSCHLFAFQGLSWNVSHTWHKTQVADEHSLKMFFDILDQLYI